MTITIEIDTQDAEEVFEILCEIPFRTPTAYDTEPPTTRPDGIESIINQIHAIIHADEPDEPPADEYFSQSNGDELHCKKNPANEQETENEFNVWQCPLCGFIISETEHDAHIHNFTCLGKGIFKRNCHKHLSDYTHVKFKDCK